MADNGTERIKGELQRVMDSMRDDMARVEILAAALSAFSRPVPEYEPAFRHMRHMQLSAHELRSSDHADA